MSTGEAVGAATSIVGGELQGWASLLDKWAMQDVYKDLQREQQGFKDQGTGIFNQAVAGQGSDRAELDLAKGANDRRAAYGAVADVPLGITLKNHGSFSDSADQAWSRLRGQSRASIGSFGDWALNSSLRNIKDQEQIRQLASFATGQAGVGNYKMYEAQHSNDALAEIGAAISSIGGASVNFDKYNSVPNTSKQNGGNLGSPFMVPQNSPEGLIYGGGSGGNLNGQILDAYSSGNADPYLGAALSLY